MMFFFIFCYISLSNLDKSDNPYEILGVSNTASQVEIRKAFQALVKKYHPDTNKDPNAERKLMKINDAYELLKNPRQRLIYDKTGSTEPTETVEDPLTETIETISLETLDDILYKYGIVFILVHSNEQGFQILVESFHQVYSKYSSYINFYRNLTTEENPSFGLRFNITEYPSILYIRKKQLKSVIQMDFDSTYEYFHSELPLDESMIEVFMNACFGVKVSHFNTLEQAKNWIFSTNDHTRILIIERSKKPSLRSHYIAAKYGSKAIFATLSDDFIQMIRELKLTKFPSALIFKGESQNSKGQIENFISVENLNDDTISEFVNTLFVKLDKNSMMNECSDFCIVKIGEKPRFGSREMNRFLLLSEYSFAYLPSSSKLATSINASDNEIYLIEGTRRRFVHISSIKHVSDFVSKRNINKLEMKKIPDGIEGDSTFKDNMIALYDRSVRYFKLHLAFFDYIVGSFLCFISDHPILVTIIYGILKFTGKILVKIFCFLCCNFNCLKKKKKNDNSNQKLKTD